MSESHFVDVGKWETGAMFPSHPAGILGMTQTNVLGAGVQGGESFDCCMGVLLSRCIATVVNLVVWTLHGICTGAAGTRERYKGTEHGLDNLVEKAKLDVVCFRCNTPAVAFSALRSTMPAASM